ncbi:hypothetical protein N665_0485s0025 [Sinapis alba]|nr:hypothetical protein N665_0485s0025 [Sinapis alba]
MKLKLKLKHDQQTKICPWLAKPADNTISPEPKPIKGSRSPNNNKPGHLHTNTLIKQHDSWTVGSTSTKQENLSDKESMKAVKRECPWPNHRQTTPSQYNEETPQDPSNTSFTNQKGRILQIQSTSGNGIVVHD